MVFIWNSLLTIKAVRKWIFTLPSEYFHSPHIMTNDHMRKIGYKVSDWNWSDFKYSRRGFHILDHFKWGPCNVALIFSSLEWDKRYLN